MTDTLQPQDGEAELKALIARYDRHHSCDEYHLHHGSRADKIPREEHQNFDDEAFKAALLQWGARQRKDELMRHMKKQCICKESGIQDCDALWHHNKNIEERIGQLDKEISGEDVHNSV